MTRHDRTDFYRDNRDYGDLLGDRGDGDEEEEEDEYEFRSQSDGRKQAQQDNPANEEYFERRQKFKELEREKLRGKVSTGSRTNGQSSALDGTTSNHASERKRLPYDNYGSFFGPSEPVVARRIIEEARGREEAEIVATRIVRDTFEPRSFKVPSEALRLSAPESRVAVTEKQAKPVNEAAVKLQRLKEARDYSFLFSDEDPTSAQQDTQPIKSSNRDKDKPKHISPQGEKFGSTAQRALIPSKASSAAKVAKINTGTQRKAPTIQQKQSHSTDKVSKPPARPFVSRPILSSQIGSNSNKKMSGPGRPSEVGASMSKAGIANGEKNATLSGALPKKVAVTGSTVNSIQSKKGQSLPSQSGSSSVTGRARVVSAPHKSVPVGNLERKSVALRPENKQHVSTARFDQKKPVSAGRVSGGYLDQRRPFQSAGPSKQATKTSIKSVDTRRTHKRPMESESGDSFLDDDDEGGGGDVSSMIRKMFGYDPNKYRNLDEEDDRNMEADFRTIQMEERRSARIARQEDEEELALIEEEERAERSRKEAKRRKLKR